MMLPSAGMPTRTIFTAAKVNAVSVSARIAALQIRWNRRFDEVRLNSFEIILSPRAEPQNTGFKFARGQFCANSVLTDLFGRAVTWIRAPHTTFDDCEIRDEHLPASPAKCVRRSRLPPAPRVDRSPHLGARGGQRAASR